MNTLYNNLRVFAKDVFSSLGPGHSERIYHNAMLVELRRAGILYDTEVVYPVEHKGHHVGIFRCDIIVTIPEGKMIVELKSVNKTYFKNTDQECTQLERYLNITGINNGLLINFPKSYDPVAFFDMDLSSSANKNNLN